MTREKETLANENLSAAKLRDNDVDKLELEITQLNTERDQLVRQLEKSQDMLLSFQQDLNMTENELKRVSNENKRLRDEAGATEKGKKIGIMINFLNLNLKHLGPNHLVLICQKQSFFHLAVALMEHFLEGITLIKTMVH